MSDPATEPGAPADTAGSNIRPASGKSIAAEAEIKVPKLTRLAATPDRIILRLNKLLANPGGLSALLSTFNYTLYLLTYLDAKSTPLKVRLYQLLNRTAAVPAVNGPSHFAALSGLISDTRTTLRLFGLLPIYAWSRQLMQGPKPGQDAVLYATEVTQCGLYVVYQFLENVAFLVDKKALPPSSVARWTQGSGGKTDGIYYWSYRAWMGGILCDVVHLFREAQLERTRRSQRTSTDVSTREEDKKVDENWWTQLIVPLGWFPVALQYSGEKGIPGWNLGIMALCGGTAGLVRFNELWAQTAA